MNLKKLKISIHSPPFNKSTFWVFLGTFVLIISNWGYVYFSYQSLPTVIPLFYTLPWGTQQLAPKGYIFIPSIISTILFTVSIILSAKHHRLNYFRLARSYSFVSLVSIIFLIGYTVRVIDLVSLSPIVAPIGVKIIVAPAIASFVSTLIVTPLVIKFARRYGFMDDPLIHKHPAMLITKPTPRAGGLAFFLGILFPALIILPFFTSQKIIGIFIGALICILMGLKDDKKDMSPYTRFALQGLAVFITVMSGIILIYIPNPFGEAIKLDSFKFVIDFMGEHKIHYFSVLAASLWTMLMMNFMSWANGTDGVYAGLVSTGALVMSILMLTTALPEDPQIAVFIKLAALLAGGGLAMALFTWPPNKLMWGFGATAPALMIAALSIIGSTKVATTLLVLMVPFLDGGFAVARRIKRGQMPFWGDREHLHHKLLDLGWSKQKIAIAYWLTTIFLGVIGLMTSGKTRALSIATIGIIVTFGISLLNFVKKPNS